MAKQIKIKHILIVFIFILILTGMMFFTRVFASVDDNVAGFAWNDNTGWISFNSTNCDPDGNGLSDSGIAGCPVGGSNHWDKINDPYTGHDGFDRYVYSDAADWVEDIYSFEDPPVGLPETITTVTYHTVYRSSGCVQQDISVHGFSATIVSLGCSSGPSWNTRTVSISDPENGNWTWNDVRDIQAELSMKEFSGTPAQVTQIYLRVTYDGGTQLYLYPDGDLTPSPDISAYPAGGGGAVVPDYGVDIDEDGDFSGYAWSSNVGWISFESADVSGCPAGTCQANLADTSVTGWAKIITLGNDGWVSLSCDNTGTCATSDHQVTFNRLTGEFSGWAWNSTVGWISFNALNCDADEDGQSDGGGACPVAGTPMSDYAVTYLDGIRIPPPAPVIAGPNSGYMNQSYEFGFLSGDDYLRNINQVVAGYYHTCALSNNNDVYCWGSAGKGQMGDGQTSTDRFTPVRVHDGEATGDDASGGYLTNMQQITGSSRHVCSISNNSNVYCWGWGDGGQLGNNQTADMSTPVRVHDGEATGDDASGGYLTNIRQISGGAHHTCAVSNNDRVYCWGESMAGRLGDNQTSTDRLTPVRVHDGEATGDDASGGYLTNMQQIETGTSHTCAVSNNGSVYCWGDSYYGRLGDGQTSTDRSTPVRVHDGEATGDDASGGYLTNMQQVSSGGYHTCAVSNNGSVYCWGQAEDGQLGDGQTSTDRSTPVRVHDGEATGDDASGGYLTNIASVSSSHQQTCAVSNNGNVYCWGRGHTGQLGNNLFIDRSTPVRVHDGEATGDDASGGYLTNIRQVSSGGYHGCSLSNNSAVYCWGSPIFGQLGDDQNATYKRTPVHPYSGEVPLTQIYYSIDWDMDGWGDEFLGWPGVLDSGTQASTTHSWSTGGSKVFQAKAVDSENVSSAWTEHTIDIDWNVAPTQPDIDGPTLGSIGQSYEFSFMSTDLSDLPIDTNGLVAEYHFDENSGTSIIDLSTNGNDGSLHGGTTWVEGHHGSALHFDGNSTSYVSIPNNATFDLTDEVSLEAWVKPESVSLVWDYHTIMGNNSNSDKGGYSLISGYDNDEAAFMFNGPITTYLVPNILSAGAPIDHDSWYHLVGTYSANTNDIKFYVNGLLYDQASQTSLIGLTNKNFYIGGDPENDSVATDEFKGVIDEVRIYNRALDAIEVMEHYNRTNKDQIRYGVDWNNDMSVDEWIPSASEYVFSGEMGTSSRLWYKAGLQTFNVIAVDDENAWSTWATYTIDISANLAPSAPIITPPEPLTGQEGVSYEFGFRSYDSNAGVELYTVVDDGADEVGDLTVDGLDTVADIYVDGNYLYIAGFDNSALTIFDITTPDAPVLKKTVVDNGSSVTGDLTVSCMAGPVSVFVKNGLAFVTSVFDSCVTVLDVSGLDSDTISEVGHVQDDGSTVHGLDGAADIDVDPTGTYAYVASDWDDAISVIHIPSLSEVYLITDDESPEVSRANLVVDALDEVDDVFVYDGYFYTVSSSDSGLTIFDISVLGTPDAPVLAYTITDDSSPEAASADMVLNALSDTEDIEIEDDVAYVLGWADSAVTILDVSDPINPVVLSTIVDDESSEVGDLVADGLEGAEDVFVKDGYLYVTANEDHTLSIFDVRDPEHPVQLHTTVDNEGGWTGDLQATVLEATEGLFVAGDYVYAGGYDDLAFGVYTAATPVDTLHYAIDWDFDDVIDSWTPGISLFVDSGEQSSSSHAWSTAITGVFQAWAIDSQGATSSPTEYSIDILANNKPAASVSLPAVAGGTYQSPVTLVGIFSDGYGELFHGFEWYVDDPTCSVLDNRVNRTYPTGYTLGEDTSSPTSTTISTDGAYQICLTVADQHEGNANQWSDCECININIGTECNDDIDNETIPDGFFDDGVIGEGTGEDLLLADPACYDEDGNYHSDYNDESADPECSDGDDNDGDGLFDDGGGDPDLADPGCFSDFDVISGVYNRFGRSEDNCGVVNPGSGELTCDQGETFGNCPSDCASEFQFIEF
jgi:alpha-tubulin suppressor-like RCC1 family protein